MDNDQHGPSPQGGAGTTQDEEKPTTPKRKAAPQRIAVTTVARQRGATLVQWDDGGFPRRGYVPAEEVRDDKVAVRVIEAATPYGLRWEERLTEIDLPDAVRVKLALALYKYGLWTIDDVRANKPRTLQTIRQACGLTYLAMLRLAEEKDNG